MSDLVAVAAPTTEATARARRLAFIGYTALGLGAVAYWLNSPWPSMELNLLAIGICVLGVWPMLRWLQCNDQAYPLFEVMQLTMVPFYAVPLITEHEAVLLYPESVLIRASSLVLVFQIFCLFGGLSADRRADDPGKRAWWQDEFVSDKNLKFTSYTLMLTTVWLMVSSFTQLVPTELVGTLRAVFFGIGIISGFILARMWGLGQLPQFQKINFVVNILLQMLLAGLSLLLINSLITLLLVLVGYFSTARRIPFVVLAITLPFFAILHNGKHKMREIYWSGYAQAMTVSKVPAYYQEWFEYGWNSTWNPSKEDDKANHSSLVQRASLLQIVCYVVDTVPDRSPYFDGETYALIPPQIFPRFVWPNKPSPNDSVKIMSVRLGMLTEEQAESTSIGYGLIAEAYANFGYYGDVVLALILGWLLRTVARATAACSTLSAGGIFRILCLAWCLNAETTLAVWLSSLYQACIAIFVPLYCYRSIFRD
jgi:hypothetical protein